jgi:hypothetical protein
MPPAFRPAWITASGEWVNDRTHGQQFKARFLRTSPSVPEFIAYAKANPGEVSYASAGLGTVVHVAGEPWRTSI